MPEQFDNLVPEDVAGQLEALVRGEGPFADVKEAELLRSEDVDAPALDDPQAEEDAAAVAAQVDARLAALEQALLNVPGVPVPVLLPDQNVEHGLVVGAFSSGTTVTIDPVDVDGADTGEANLSVYVQADRTSATVNIADGAEVTWERFDTIEDDGTAGVLIGTLISDEGDELVAVATGQTADFLKDVLVVVAAGENLSLTQNGANYDLAHTTAGAHAICYTVCSAEVLSFDANGHYKGVIPPGP